MSLQEPRTRGCRAHESSGYAIYCKLEWVDGCLVSIGERGRADGEVTLQSGDGPMGCRYFFYQYNPRTGEYSRGLARIKWRISVLARTPRWTTVRTMHYCSARTPCIHRERSSLTITRQILLSLKKNEDRRTNKKYIVGPEGFAGDAFFFFFF